MNFPLYIYSICIGFLAALMISFRRDTAFYLRLFAVFLFLTLLVEAIGVYSQLHDINNIALYNIFTTVEFVFYFFVLNQVLGKKKAKRVVFHITWIYALLAGANIFFIQKITVFHTMTYSLGCLLVVAICIYYFLEIFQLPHSVNLARQPAFWICSGLLFYY